MDVASSILLSLPFETREKIWSYAKPTNTTIISCCKCSSATPALRHIAFCQTSATRKDARACIRPFSEIVDSIDPLQVWCHGSKLKHPKHVFSFCSIACLNTAMRISTTEQRSIISACIRVAYTADDVAWIQSAPNTASIPMSIIHQQPFEMYRTVEYSEEEGDSGEERIGVLMEWLFEKLERLGKKYFDGRSVMVGEWSGKDGGSGWVEMRL